MSEEIQAIKRMNHLRGLFALLIVLGHCSTKMVQVIMPLTIIHRFNMICVCFFFVISGWSLAYNFYNKENYLKRFLLNKPFKLFLFALVCELMQRLIAFILMSHYSRINMQVLTNFNWYIYEAVAFYIAFYFVYRFAKNKNVRVILMTIVSLIVSVVSVYCSNHYESFWTHAFHFSSFCFVWGIVLHEYYDLFKVLVKKKIISTLVLMVIGIASCICVKMPQGGFLGGCVLHNLVGISVVTVIGIWAHYIDFTKIRILGWFTTYATEIYLYQFVILNLIETIFMWNGKPTGNDYLLMVLLFTMMISCFMHVINQGISDLLAGRKQQ